VKQAARSKRQLGAFVPEAQPVSGEDADDEAWVAQMTEWLTAPRARSSANVIRRVIARVECLA
jgi:hypothetical protein